MPSLRSSSPTVRSCSSTSNRASICARRPTQRQRTMPSCFRSGPARTKALQLLHLLRRKRRRAALAADIAQALNTVRVMAVNPVPQRLAVHPARLRRQQAQMPVQHHRQRQQPTGLLGVRRPRRRTKPRAVQLRPHDRNRCHAAHPEATPEHMDSHPQQLGKPWSQGQSRLVSEKMMPHLHRKVA